MDRLLHPLDNLLSYQQLHGESLVPATLKLYRQGGWEPFLRGFLYPLLTFGPARLLMSSLYYNSKDLLITLYQISPPQAFLCSGLLAGILDATLTNPGEISRIRRFFNLCPPTRTVQWYRGFPALLVRSCIGATIILAGADLLIFSSLEIPPLLAGFFSGGLSQIFTCPVDVWKNSIMADDAKRSAIFHLKKIYKEKGFYRGFTTKFLRMALGSSLVIGTFYALTA